MTDFPLLANFAVVSVSALDEVTSSSSRLATRQRLSLVLRARPEVEIELPSGEPLSNLQVHLTLQAGSASPRDLATELTEDEVGFLLHSKVGADPSFIHGAVVWPNAHLPYHLLTNGLTANVLLSFSSVSQVLEYEDSHVWQPGRAAMLRIASYSISCTSALVAPSVE